MFNIDNINKTLKEDLQQSIHKGSKISIAAACFSIYAYQELKKQLESIDELRLYFYFANLYCMKKRQRLSENFTFPGFPVSAAFMVRNLRLSCVMS